MQTRTFSARLSRGAVGAVALAALSTGCSNLKDELLAPQQPNVISPSDITSATGAEGLYVGAVGRFAISLNGSPNNSGSNQEAAWNEAGLFTDEFRNSDTFSQRVDSDHRQLQTNDALITVVYAGLQQGRGFARDAAAALIKYEPTAKAKIAEMYFDQAFEELTLGQEFCNGIPLGTTVAGVPQYTQPLTTQQVFQQAAATFDSALTYVSGATDAASKNVAYAATVAKARALVDQGQFAAAAALVGSVPTSFQFNVNYSNTTVDNEWWILGPSVKRYTLGDTTQATAPVLINFLGNNDPRVPLDPSVSGVPGQLSSVTFNWTKRLSGRDDPLPVVSGIDARLIEAENQLQTGDYAGMVATLNNLRSTSQTIGAFTVPAMSPITTIPASKDQAIQLLFREKGFWQFGRGVRMDDLRRLVRQYGYTQDQAFPSGAYPGGGTYGNQTNWAVPDAERTNPNFKGCIDRNA
jgi:hypothetical protein